MPAPVPKRSVETPELDIKSVLLLDDNLDLAETLKELLEMQNFVVTAVANGAEGLREVMALDSDVIICDMMMPHMRGDMFYLPSKKQNRIFASASSLLPGTPTIGASRIFWRRSMRWRFSSRCSRTN